MFIKKEVSALHKYPQKKKVTEMREGEREIYNQTNLDYKTYIKVLLAIVYKNIMTHLLS